VGQRAQSILGIGTLTSFGWVCFMGAFLALLWRFCGTTCIPVFSPKNWISKSHLACVSRGNRWRIRRSSRGAPSCSSHGNLRILSCTFLDKNQTGRNQRFCKPMNIFCCRICQCPICGVRGEVLSDRFTSTRSPSIKRYPIRLRCLAWMSGEKIFCLRLIILCVQK
jgi:hypothetical protein